MRITLFMLIVLVHFILDVNGKSKLCKLSDSKLKKLTKNYMAKCVKKGKLLTFISKRCQNTRIGNGIV